MKSFVILCCLLVSASTFAAEAEYNIALKNHRFEPAVTTVPAGKKLRLVVENKDATPDEFHSDALGVEKIISGNSKVVILVGPLKPGKHSFMGEFNASTAQGTIIAK